MTKEKELTQVTNELLERTNILRENGKKSMMKGEVNVLRGIIIFEVILKEINPEVMDDAEINVVKNYINVYMVKKEEETQQVNNYVHYGLNLCLSMLDNYVKEKKTNLTR